LSRKKSTIFIWYHRK